MAKINLLDKNVAELIAAGEVIERPSSVIKELVENSIDAGATSITVEIKQGGIAYMRVTDDGCGIEFDQIPTAFLRHATSKVYNADDLEKITTLGFRGEALASITAVAKVEMLTKQATDDLGAIYKTSGGEEECHDKTGCPDGTTIIIRDLFFNTPARLKFLNKDVWEGNKVQSIVSNLAIAHPEISFRFIRDNKQTLLTGGDGKYLSAIRSVLGKEFAMSLIPVDFNQQGVNVSGYVSSPLFTKPKRSMQFFFVNSRYITSGVCIKALEEGYRNSIMVGKFPACVLNIEIDPSFVDVNVHPAKTEVKFANDSSVFTAVLYATKNAIMNADSSREINLNKKIPTAPVYSSIREPVFSAQSVKKENEYTSFPEPLEKKEPLNEEKPKAEIQSEVSNSYNKPNSFADHSLRLNSDSTDYGEDAEIPLPPEPPVKAKEADEPIMANCFRFLNKNSFRVEYTQPQKKEEQLSIIEESQGKPEFIGEIFRTYIICRQGDNMYIIDKHAAHERIRFEKLKTEYVKNSQLLVEKASLRLDVDAYNAVCEQRELLAGIGIDILPSENFTVEILAVPVMLAQREAPETILAKVADILQNNNTNAEGEIYDDILHTFACKSAIKANDINADAELITLMNEVFENEKIRFCPHGRPVMIKMSKKDIEKQFNRI